jgi:uncharacterized protein (TIGR03118 family)
MKLQHLVFAFALGAVACSKNNNNNNGYGGNPPPTPGVNFVQTNIVSDLAGAGVTDPTLQDAWGIAINPTQGAIWIASNHGGVSDVYDETGKTLLAPVSIPSPGAATGGSPTGVVFNGTADFMVPNETAATKFIFVNEDGVVSAWPLGAASAMTVADRSAAGAVYKGCTIAVDGGANFLYAANFKGGTIDVFDKSFNLVTGRAFNDPAIPAGFGPFNIANIGGNLYVTYAKLQGPDNEDDQAGAGNGYVDVFTPDGKLVKNFASKGALNSPWGIAQVPDGFGIERHSILIGNFGDGWINIYDSTGVYKGPLQSNGQPIVVSGLWALDIPFNEYPQADPGKLYFTAGFDGEQHGVFGYFKKQ